MSINYFTDHEAEKKFCREYNITEKEFYYSEQYEGMKVRQRYLCWKYLPMLRDRVIRKDDVAINSNFEAVFLEFRWFKHIEFIIRNAIIKLGPLWSQTIVCGNENYENMKNMCDKINPNIKIIKLPIDGLDPMDREGRNPKTSYNGLLTSEDFWNLFTGVKILIHQEDSCIFRDDIEQFLHFDYIGAPWNPDIGWVQQSGLKIAAGNGGFSLRNKNVMLNVIQNFDRDPQENEDVYFSRMIQDHNLGTFPTLEEAWNFSSEGIINRNSFGGHCYFNYDVESEKRFVNDCVLSIYKGETVSHIEMRPVQERYF